MLLRLVTNPKVLSSADLIDLIKVCDTGKRLEDLLLITDNAAQLLDFLTKIGGAGEAANLEKLLVGIGLLKGSNQSGRAQLLVNEAAANAGMFSTYVTWVERLAGRVNPGPTLPAPPEVAAFGFTGGANTLHFLEHTWKFFDIGKRLTKTKGTTMWPPPTEASAVMDALGEALTHLNPGGGPRLPAPSTGFVAAHPTTLGPARVGNDTCGGGRIGAFFPGSGENISQKVCKAMDAIFD